MRCEGFTQDLMMGFERYDKELKRFNSDYAF